MELVSFLFFIFISYFEIDAIKPTAYTSDLTNWQRTILDVLFIGPYDLSISLGYPVPSPDPHPEVEEVIQKILKAAHESQKKW